MTTLLSKDDFVNFAMGYKKELAIPRSLDELHELWKKTSCPYRINSTDPFSKEYRDEVMSIYEDLCNESYTVMNELTSSLQSPEEFEIGYPWMSKNLRIVASEMGKYVSALKVMAQFSPSTSTFIEFGSGWGNLAIPLARAGMEVTVVDIDPGFLKRTNNEAQSLKIKIRTILADFISAVDQLECRRYHNVVFCSSLHHCLDFINLLEIIRDRVLCAYGAIYFFAEPIIGHLEKSKRQLTPA